jgi:RimJ/RimL family protein N-acetyltransferase
MVIETERLLLRRLTIDDLDELVAIHADPDIARVFGPFGHDRARSWLGEVDQNWRDHGHGRMAITGRVTGRLLGRTGLAHFPDPDPGEVELGWTLRRDAWGRGYATEAARACADSAFQHFQIPYLTSRIEPGNERSIRVANRLGMVPLREDVFFDLPMTVYAVTRETWLASPIKPR